MNQLAVRSLSGSFKFLSALVLLVLVSLFANAQTRHSGKRAEQSGVLTYTESVLHTFTATPDGRNPATGLVADSAGNLYGSTYYGGTYCVYYWGCGTIFELTPNGNGGWTYNPPFSLPGGNTGAAYPSGLTIDSQRNLYAFSPACVYEVSPSDGNWVLSNAYCFTGGSDGSNPTSLIVDSAGNVYGTTHMSYDPEMQYGTFWELTTTNDQWFEQTPYGFSGADNGKHGEYPTALAMDKKGDFYGHADGTPGNEIIFKLHYSATKGWGETITHTFQGAVGDGDGGPTGNLTFGSDGNIYYGTSVGGLGYGGVYKLTPSGKVTSLYAFTGADGSGGGDVTFDNAGNLYGTVGGAVYKLTPPSSGQTTWSENVLYTFTGGADGGSPVGPLVIDDGGDVYGTTTYGGLNYGQYGFGVVFELAPNPVATTTTITKNAPNPSKTGQVVTVGFTVTQTVKANSQPTGTVTVSASTGESCIESLPLNGKASCKLLFATAGTRTLTATYSGDAADQGSVSDAVTQSTSNTTSTKITDHTPDPAKVGQTVTVHFSVDAKDAIKRTKPTGSVTVTASTGESCTGTLSGAGGGKCQLTFGSAEITILTATYAGDADNNASVSKAVEQAVE